MDHEAFESEVKSAALRIWSAIHQEAAALETTVKIAPASTVPMLLRFLQEFSGGMHADGRACLWRARLRLYVHDDPGNEPVADSDPDYPPEAAGTTVHQSLPRLVTWIVELASAYHKAPMAGLDEHTMQRRLRSFRTQLSHRRDGTGVMRTEYTVNDRWYIMRCDVEKVEERQ